jgi:hypothetical protein
MGDFMLTGVEPEHVQCVAGKVVGMMHDGLPGFVVNEHGQGKAFYSAILLGTVYEAAPTAYEWDTTHSGLSYHRLLNAFLRYAGVQPGCNVTGLSPRVRAKLRVESPLIAPDGNVLVGLTSLNDDAVKPFDLEVILPAGSGPFSKVFVATQGGRYLESPDYRLDGAKLSLHLPAFDTHAMIIALKDAPPLVSLQPKEVDRGPAALAVIHGGQRFEVEVVTYNPSPRTVDAGQVSFIAPAGWLQSPNAINMGAIKPGGEARCTFQVQAPEMAGACRITPLVAKFTNATTKSTPATEMVWWGLMEQP